MKLFNLILTDLDKPNKINHNTFFLSDWITNKSLEKKKLIKKSLENFKKKTKAYNYIDKIRPEGASKLTDYIFIYHKKKSRYLHRDSN